MVGMTGLEPAASCSQSKHSTTLSYIPGGSSGIYVYFREVKSISFVLPEPMSKKRIPSIEGGWDNWIRTSGMTESKSAALPLGHIPILSKMAGLGSSSVTLMNDNLSTIPSLLQMVPYRTGTSHVAAKK